ncbi:polyisoprenoid-binding protein YceI [Mucilaginibacter lappiensis]|uniref:Polyisoprenoid-binding protein YceI n=1 Tax=Mucilaginibacter lappiensis TaxID=354630 RepID=A0ABR6PQF0_9SPHI|nr:YceI family protein [Mucilaginibacter lappiensis]MBB6112008.1 polyisoprenoid-binding protein YceI [Mucilaginibacter lappiensis]
MTTKLTIATYSAAIISIATLTTAFTPNKSTASHPIKTTTAHKHYKAQNFKVDNQGSKLTWQAKKATGDHNGEVKISNGQFTSENNVLKSGTFDIDLNTITDADLIDQASNDKLVSTLKSETFFSTDKFPKANFAIVSATKTSGNQYDIKGKLTIKGITNDVSFPATLAISGKKLNATAKITVDRTKYDIKFRSKNFFENLGDKVIYDDFDLNVNLVANAQ